MEEGHTRTSPSEVLARTDIHMLHFAVLNFM